ncbi:MAG TPA: hypothetical protein VGM03_10170 [Phycisphaerae bacterium]
MRVSQAIRWSGCARIRRTIVPGIYRYLALSVPGLLAFGCSQPAPRFAFPAQRTSAGEIALDINHDGRPDYWQELDLLGRKVAVRFADNHDGTPGAEVRLDTPVAPDDLRVTIILDGVPYELINELYQQGYFRLFPPAGKVVSIFPVMTDLALSRALTNRMPLGYEALYFDREANRLSDGNDVYLKGLNAPWWSEMDYRVSTSWDVRTYLSPKAVWRHELEGFLKTIRGKSAGVVRVYSVGTAGLGTLGGRAAISAYLKDVDQLCEQITYERRGKVRFTLFADHGHGLTPDKRVSYDDVLRRAGFRVTKRLARPDDAVVIDYGLVTCAVIHTNQPQRAADAVVAEQATDLVVYRLKPDADEIIVRNSGGQAVIRRQDNGSDIIFTYDYSAGDPLDLAPLAPPEFRETDRPLLSASDREWFRLTVDHRYPDPLFRIWDGFCCLARHPADMIVSLKEGYFAGSAFFAAFAKVESTHGALSAGSSNTFLLSNDIEVPRACRIGDLRFILPGRQTYAAREKIGAAKTDDAAAAAH